MRNLPKTFTERQYNYFPCAIQERLMGRAIRANKLRQKRPAKAK